MEGEVRDIVLQTSVTRPRLRHILPLHLHLRLLHRRKSFAAQSRPSRIYYDLCPIYLVLLVSYHLNGL